MYQCRKELMSVGEFVFRVNVYICYPELEAKVWALMLDRDINDQNLDMVLTTSKHWSFTKQDYCIYFSLYYPAVCCHAPCIFDHLYCHTTVSGFPVSSLVCLFSFCPVLACCNRDKAMDIILLTTYYSPALCQSIYTHLFSSLSRY